MTTREKMIKWRNEMGVTIKSLSRRSGISETLLGMVEGGQVTHPVIAKRIQKLYGLTDKEAEELVPKIHRKSDPEYDPDKYVTPVRESFAQPARKVRDREEIDDYLFQKTANVGKKM